MRPSFTAHIDTFCRDNMPAKELWPELLFNLPGLQYPARLNCAVELLDKVADRIGVDHPCLLTPDAPPWTYGDLRRVSNQVAAVLVEDYGIVPGNRVLLRGPNNPWLVACWFAIIKAGAVAVTTMPMLREVELTKIANAASVDLALCDARFTEALTASDVAGLRVAEFGGDAGLTTAIESKAADFTAVDTAADDVALLAFTSGTTGRPKATMHFHRDVLAVADTFSAHVLKPVTTDIFTGTPPVAFTFGLGGLVVFPLRVGAATLLLEKATPDELADHIAQHEVTICFTAPTAYRAMVASGNAHKISTLRRAVAAGEHLPASTWHAVFDATGVKLINGIGATEMLHIFVASPTDEIKVGSTGRAVPGYVVAVLDDQGKPQPPGTPGQLAVKGPTGCRYLADDRQGEYVKKGWNVTGDTFIQDADGYLWYQARSDDMIVSSGYNIAAPEVEEALLTHPDVSECAVAGVPDIDRGQLVTAFVVLREGVDRGARVATGLQDFVKQRIAPYKYPRRVVFVDELPKTSSGKLQRSRLPGVARDGAKPI
ncbi:AMP-binding protein [Mycobacterium sp. Aquia_216]|uniref:AMP-binding protein n=1 Tax=Mycobacterium sp. Aquia_216 TaxID=2991729 RepID=UPI00227A4E95|nr:AMP-binding protein [Mycobacterium sp. Aquia_216]WAJ46623.1 AMP-binding protein [Mycobacterium sp. Aquia_216]